MVIRGFHFCEYCRPGQTRKYSNTSSGDTTLVFDNGHTYQVSDMILHYVFDHQFKPPNVFIEDVMNARLLDGRRAQTKSIGTSIGYLRGEYPIGPVPVGFVEKLEVLLKEANEMGNRIQYRGH